MKKAVSIKQKKKRDEFTSKFVAFIPLLGWLLFGILPLAMSGIVAFTELHSTDLRDMKFVGLQNFITILTNADEGRTYASYLSTIVFSLNVPVTLGVSLYIANLINRTKIGNKFFRTVFFIPFVCSTVVVSMTFRMLFATEGGLINQLLSDIGFQPVAWLTDTPESFMAVAIILSVWSGIGWCILLFLAALSSVDASYYESAKLDGATPFQMFWKITWPAISPTTSYLVTMRLIGALQSMSEMYVLVGGSSTSSAPTWGNTAAYVSDTVVKHIYNMIFENSYKYGYGLAAAAGWILAIIVLVITRINLKMQERWVNYDF